jgi:hypothetical protein
LGAPQYRLLRYGENASKRQAGKQSKTPEATFRRNSSLTFLVAWISKPAV